MSLIEQGIQQGLIRFDDDKKNIFYLHQNKRRNFNNPEEQVQAETFLKLVLEYGYPVERVQQFVSVKMGVSTKEADIVVYKDKECLSPYIIVECKSQKISDLAFKETEKQAISYANALAGTTKFIWITKGNISTFYRFDKDKNKQNSETDIPYFGETDTKKYKYAKGGIYTDKIKGKPTKIKTDDIKAVSENELTDIFKQAHDALWAGGELDPSQAFDELDKLIFCKIWDERNTKKGHPYKFQIFSEHEDDEEKILIALKARIVELYELGKIEDPEVFNKPIELSPKRIKTIVGYFQEVSLSETDLDSKGKAFETFLGTYFRGKFGQYFTPRNVVKFAVGVLPITHKNKVLDTSCGSGGFLLYCLDKVRKQADKDFPDYETDMNDRDSWKRQWHNFASKNLFGIEINDQISRVAKMNMIIHDDGQTNVINFDGLFQTDYIRKNCNGGEGNKGFSANSFDYIVTNPPFGSIVKQSEKAYMQVDSVTNAYYGFGLKEVNWIEAKVKNKHTATGRENQSTEILFIEQCHKFLKAGGYLAIVIPDGILTNSSLQYVRDGIEERFRIIAVVSLPQTTFANTGAGVKSSVLFLKKYSDAETEKIRRLKQDLQEALVTETELVDKVKTWEKEKADLVKKGDEVCQQLEADLSTVLSELKQQGNLTKELKTQEEKKTKALRKAHEKTEAFIKWKKAVSVQYTEKINAFKEDLEEQYQAEKQAKLDNYPIFMAIAENIGYDATGRSTNQLLTRSEVEDDSGETVITEVYENDLFNSEVQKRRQFENGKIVEVQFQENIIPETGITGALAKFIEEVNAGKK